MIVGVVGSRNFSNYSLLKDELSKHDIFMIVSGGAKGADSLAEKYSRERAIPIAIYEPDYIKYGKSAPIIRNKEIVRLSDLVIAFWDGKSTGTKFVIDYCHQTNTFIQVIKFTLENK